MSISSYDDTDSNESDGEYDTELDVDMCRKDDVNSPDGVDNDGDVDMERGGEDGEHEQEEDEKEEEVVDEDEEEDEDNGKEPRTIGQGEMVNTSADNVDTMVDDEATVLPGQVPEMCEYTQRPPPPAPAALPQTPKPPPQPRTLETHTLRGLEFLGLETPLKPRPAAPTLREADAARNTADADVEQQLPGESADDNGLPDALCRKSLSGMSLSPMSLSPMTVSLMTLSLRRAGMAR